MPKVHHVKKARHRHGIIKKGESYYWWKFRRGPKQFSTRYPRPSQLTQSPFWSQLFAIQEGLPNDPDSVEDAISQLVDDLASLRDETQEKVDNVPDSLTDSPTAELLRDRVEALDEAINTIESLDDDQGSWDLAASTVEEISCG